MPGTGGFARLGFSSLMLLWLACEGSPPTRVIVELDAEESVQALTESLRLVVEGGEDVDRLRGRTTRLDLPLQPVDFPLTVEISPRGGDVSRAFVLTATAFDNRGRFVSEVRLITGYVPHKTLRPHLLIPGGSCLHKQCNDDRETCSNGDCVEATVRPEDLPEDGPIKLSDGGAELTDAAMDGSEPNEGEPEPDAGPSGGEGGPDAADSDSADDSGGTGGDANTQGPAALSAGDSHTCVVRADGSARCWGSNRAGQLGHGAAGPSMCMAGTEFEPCAQRPMRVANLEGVTGISAGGENTCALLRSGSVSCSGSNVYGELGIGSAQGPSLCPFLGIQFQCSREPVVVPALDQVRSISSRGGYTCALLDDGTARCWGYNFFWYQSESGPSTCDHAGYTHACALVPVMIDGLVQASALATGGSHTCAIAFNGVVQCWGSNLTGKLGDGTTMTSLRPGAVSGLGSALAVSTGGFHTCALAADHTVACWGDNRMGQLGVSPSAAPDQCPLSNGPVPCATKPLSLSTPTRVAAISAGGNHTCALLEDTTVQCWGQNLYGQLGIGFEAGPSLCLLGPGTSYSCSPQPRAVPNLSGVIAISSGANHTCALRGDGSVACWGLNMHGQLGNGSTVNSAAPVDVLW